MQRSCRGDHAALGQCVGEDVQHHFAVGGGVQVPAIVLVDALDDLLDVGQIAVMGEDDAVG